MRALHPLKQNRPKFLRKPLRPARNPEDQNEKLLFLRGHLHRRKPRGGNMYPVGGKSFRPVEKRGRAVQPFGKRVIDANSRGGQAAGEELEDFHAMARGGLWAGG